MEIPKVIWGQRAAYDEVTFELTFWDGGEFEIEVEPDDFPNASHGLTKGQSRELYFKMKEYFEGK